MHTVVVHPSSSVNNKLTIVYYKRRRRAVWHYVYLRYITFHLLYRSAVYSTNIETSTWQVGSPLPVSTCNAERSSNHCAVRVASSAVRAPASGRGSVTTRSTSSVKRPLLPVPDQRPRRQIAEPVPRSSEMAPVKTQLDSACNQSIYDVRFRFSFRPA